MGAESRFKRVTGGLPREFAGADVPLVGRAQPHRDGVATVHAVALHVLVTCGTCEGAAPMLVSPPGVGVCRGCGKPFVVRRFELTTNLETGVITPHVEITRLDAVVAGPAEAQ